MDIFHVNAINQELLNQMEPEIDQYNAITVVQMVILLENVQSHKKKEINIVEL